MDKLRTAGSAIIVSPSPGMVKTRSLPRRLSTSDTDRCFSGLSASGPAKYEDVFANADVSVEDLVLENVRLRRELENMQQVVLNQTKHAQVGGAQFRGSALSGGGRKASNGVSAADFDALQQAVQRKNEQLDRMRKHLGNTAAELEARELARAAAQRELEDCEERRAVLSDKFAGECRRSEDMQKRLQGSEERSEELQRRLSSALGESEARDSLLRDADARRAALEAELREQRGRGDALQAECEQLQPLRSRSDALQQKLNEVEAALAEQQQSQAASVTQLREELQSSRAQAEAAIGQEAALRAQLAEAASRADRLATQLAEAKASHEALVADLARSQEESKQAAARRDEAVLTLDAASQAAKAARAAQLQERQETDGLRFALDELRLEFQKAKEQGQQLKSDGEKQRSSSKEKLRQAQADGDRERQALLDRIRELEEARQKPPEPVVAMVPEASLDIYRAEAEAARADADKWRSAAMDSVAKLKGSVKILVAAPKVAVSLGVGIDDADVLQATFSKELQEIRDVISQRVLPDFQQVLVLAESQGDDEIRKTVESLVDELGKRVQAEVARVLPNAEMGAPKRKSGK